MRGEFDVPCKAARRGLSALVGAPVSCVSPSDGVGRVWLACDVEI